MTGTITVRLPGPTLRKLRARARSLGVSASELIRRLVTEPSTDIGVEPTAYELTRKWVGSVGAADVPRGRDAREALEHWNPDRRG